MTNQAPPTIDPTAAQRWQNHPSSESPWLHEEIARRMEERLDWIKLQPQSWAHWEPLRGGMQAHALLAPKKCNLYRDQPRTSPIFVPALPEPSEV